VANGWEGHESPYLPPFDARLIQPGERIPTPVDYRGLIDLDQLIAEVTSTVDPEYEWPRGLSVHHLYWPENRYPYVRSVPSSSNPRYFINLPINKALVPRVFENWVHACTEPVIPPDSEVMQYITEAWQIASHLFKTVRANIHWERMARRRRVVIASDPERLREDFDGEDLIGEAYMHDVFRKNFRVIEEQIVRSQRIPPEFRMIDLEAPPEAIAKQLGKVMVPRAVNRSRLVAA
jgi:hypothetical protein